MKSRLILLLLTIPFVAMGTARPLYKGRFTKEKKITKEYSVHPDALLKIDNSYGNVDVTSWEENIVSIQILVRTNGNDEEDVQDKLDEINVAFNASSDFVNVQTIFSKSRLRSWWNSWKNNKVNMEVHYEIKVPLTNNLDISNDYGGISLNASKGNVKINCDYGKITIGELLGEENNLHFDYTKNSTIGFMRSGSIIADYSAFTLEKGGTIMLNADYTKSEFGAIENLHYNCDYGSLYTSSSQEVKGQGDYLTTRLGTVNGSLHLNADYGSIRINELSRDASDVSIQSDYTGIKIGYNAEYRFTFKISLEYAGLSGTEEFEITKKRIQSSDKYYEGYYGNSLAPHNISINSEYGGVTFTRLN